VLPQVLSLAFLVVGAGTALLIPIMLYVFQLHKQQWNWASVAVLGSIVASTDAVAIIAVMKSSAQPAFRAEHAFSPRARPEQLAARP
jgi:NhaP-type Na+/H+ or K+/H+ antiporter